MKKIDNILHNLFSKNKKFSEQQCFNKLLNTLPLHLRNMVLYIYKKDQTLFFVLKHPGFQIEFNYSKKLINDILKLLKEKEEICQNLIIKQIKSYAKYSTKKELPKKKMFSFKEIAKGRFKIEAKNGEIREIFIKIKEAIKKNGSTK
jgi:hypothetical protein